LKEKPNIAQLVNDVNTVAQIGVSIFWTNLKKKPWQQKQKHNEVKKMDVGNNKRFLPEGKYLMMGNVNI